MVSSLALSADVLVHKAAGGLGESASSVRSSEVYPRGFFLSSHEYKEGLKAPFALCKG